MRPLVALGLFVASTLLFARFLDRPFDNGDEAIYAEFAREMARSGDVLCPRWQGSPVFSRPPASVWPLAVAWKLGHSDRAIRVAVVLESALGVALLFLLGARRYGTAVGVVAAVLLATADRYLFYARYLESEPLLIALVTGTFLCWEIARERPRWIWAWGAMLGLSLLTKQVVGALPLIALFCDWLEKKAIDRKQVARGLAVTAALTIPWFLIETIRFGRPFVSVFLLRSVVSRATQPLHSTTTPAFYLVDLWVRETQVILIAAVGLVWTAWKRDFLPLVWGLGVLLAFTLAASRYSYYVLLAYPAFALAMARVSWGIGRAWLAVPVALLWMTPHLIMDFNRPAKPQDAETGTLAAAAQRMSQAGDELIVVDQLPYAARYYGDRHTTAVLFRREDYDAIAQIFPGNYVVTPDAVSILKQFPRWFAIVHRQDLPRLDGAGTVHLVGKTEQYLLLTNLSGVAR